MLWAWRRKHFKAVGETFPRLMRPIRNTFLWAALSCRVDTRQSEGSTMKSSAPCSACGHQRHLHPHTHTSHLSVCAWIQFLWSRLVRLKHGLGVCVCINSVCVCVCVRLHDCPLISTIWAHSLPAVSPVTKRSGWLSAAINNTNKRSAGAGGNHFPPCWNGVSYIFSLGSLLTGSVFVCVLSAGSETFLPRWGNNFWEIKSLNCANRLMRLWKVQSPISSFLLGKKALSAKKVFIWKLLIGWERRSESFTHSSPDDCSCYAVKSFFC